jgi:pilus assembly protein CpaF
VSLYKRLHEQQGSNGSSGGSGAVAALAPVVAAASASPPHGGNRRDPVLDELRQKIHHHLIDELGPILYDKRLSEDDLRRRVQEQLQAALAQERAPLSAADKAQLIQDVSDDILGYGPIDRLLKDEDISEVMVNGPNSVYVEKSGKVEKTTASFVDDTHLRRIIDKIVGQVGSTHRRGAAPLRRPPPRRLPRQRRDPPARHRRAVPHHPEVLEGSVPDRRSDPLRHAQRGLGPLPAGDGRRQAEHLGGRRHRHRQDHHLNVLSSFIPSDERIITVEDAKELQLHQDHVLALEARPPNIEGKGQITIRDLVKNTLRMRPDRIVVGECRAGEALDMLQAMNTGHDGSLTTIHANTPRDTLSRLETLVLMAGFDLPVRAIREQIASAIDCIVQLTRLKDGTRRITHVTEIQGMEGDVITLQDVFLFDFGMGVDEHGKYRGHLKATGVRPKFAEKLADQGIRLGPEVFQPEAFAKRAQGNW